MVQLISQVSAEVGQDKPRLGSSGHYFQILVTVVQDNAYAVTLFDAHLQQGIRQPVHPGIMLLKSKTVFMKNQCKFTGKPASISFYNILYQLHLPYSHRD